MGALANISATRDIRYNIFMQSKTTTKKKERGWKSEKSIWARGPLFCRYLKLTIDFERVCLRPRFSFTIYTTKLYVLFVFFLWSWWRFTALFRRERKNHRLSTETETHWASNWREPFRRRIHRVPMCLCVWFQLLEGDSIDIMCVCAHRTAHLCVHCWFPCHLMSNVSASTVRPHTLMLRLIWYGLLFHTHSIWFAIICRRKPNAHAKRKLEMIALSHIEPIKMPSLAYSINTLLAFCNKNKNKEF